MLGHRRRRWPNIERALVERELFFGYMRCPGTERCVVAWLRLSTPPACGLNAHVYVHSTTAHVSTQTQHVGTALIQCWASVVNTGLAFYRSLVWIPAKGNARNAACNKTNQSPIHQKINSLCPRGEE